MNGPAWLAITAALVVVAGPLMLGGLGLLAARKASPSGPRVRHAADWKLTTMSALLFTLAFDLTFIVQELFLVLSKAFTPGLRPTLFHNNHDWTGENALAALFQGTGVVATLVTGVACALLARRMRNASTALRLLLFWLAYCGLFMALPQVVVGAISARSDVGMAMDYLQLDPAAKTAAALAALVLMPLLAQMLARSLLGLAGSQALIDTAGGRTRFVFGVATLPMLMALPMIVAFRVPRDWIEVVVVPAVVCVCGGAWLQAGAWRATGAKAGGRPTIAVIAWPLASVGLLLLLFQGVLRPGIRFY